MATTNEYIHCVTEFIAKHHLLDASALHLVALSGGADSTALLLTMKELNYRIEAVHCNFHLRGEESNHDEKFCEDLCLRLSIPFHRVHFDTTGYASLHKMSIEMAARKLRYDYFEQLRQDLDANDILVAHHKEDNVETLLINLIRGTGIHGLCGISPKNGHIVRPLLAVRRQQIEDYLKIKGQNFVTDSTNLKDDVVRNKLRLNIIPLLQAINPGVIDNIDSTSRHLTEAANIVDENLESFLKRRQEIVCYLTNPDNSSTPIQDAESEDFLETGAEINIETLLKYASPEYMLFHILQKYDFTGLQTEQIYDNINGGSGRMWYSPTHELVIDRGTVIVKRISHRPEHILRVPEEGNYVYDDEHTFHIQEQDMTSFSLIKDAHTACLDADKVMFPLTIRKVQNGDRFIPFGMKGSKLVSDYLTDHKKSLFEKRDQTVVTDAQGNIVWLVDERPDNRFCIDSQTKKVVLIHC